MPSVPFVEHDIYSCRETNVGININLNSYGQYIFAEAVSLSQAISECYTVRWMLTFEKKNKKNQEKSFSRFKKIIEIF